MFLIQPNALYTKHDLTEMLVGTGVDVDTFISRLQCRKVFKKLWYGEDLLYALKNAPALTDTTTKARPSIKTQTKRSIKKVKQKIDIGDPLQQIIDGVGT